MKKLLLSVVTLLTLSFSLQAQDYGALEWDLVRLGYVIPSGDGVGAGLAFSTEPRYNINNNLSASLRMEFAFFGSADDSGSADIGAVGSYTLFGDYYFQTESNTRAFAGLGLGTFGGASVSIDDGMGNVTEASGDGSLGIVPRIGYELGILRITGEYNLLFSENSSNYIGIHLGFTIGGRR